MYRPLKYFKLVEPQLRNIATNVKPNQRGHYDALGISAKATQADIKSAYYKLSMVYHPDKNKDSEDAAKKFRDITEAYEVLGNVRLRKLYDKGLYIHNVGTTTVDEDTPLSKFYRSRENRSRPPSAYGRTTEYNFDEWSRAHYGSTFQKDMRFKEHQRFKKMREERINDAVKTEKVVFLFGLLGLLSAYLFYDKDFDNPDKVSIFGGNIIVSPKSE